MTAVSRNLQVEFATAPGVGEASQQAIVATLVAALEGQLTHWRNLGQIEGYEVRVVRIPDPQLGGGAVL